MAKRYPKNWKGPKLEDVVAKFPPLTKALLALSHATRQESVESAIAAKRRRYEDEHVGLGEGELDELVFTRDWLSAYIEGVRSCVVSCEVPR